jgi:hypothetical protein
LTDFGKVLRKKHAADAAPLGGAMDRRCPQDGRISPVKSTCSSQRLGASAEARFWLQRQTHLG